jgi:cytochrome bd-type quinol oxidase subunit 2
VLTIVGLVLTPVVVLYQGRTYYVFQARVGGEQARSPAELLGPKAENAPAG